MKINRQIVVSAFVAIAAMFASLPGNGQGIDTLTTTQDVQAYLIGNLYRSSTRFFSRPCDLSLEQLVKQMYTRALSTVDTYDLIDPVNGKHVLRTVQLDSGYVHPEIFQYTEQTNKSPQDIINILAKTPYRFYKCDIDGNGRTDLVIDAGTTVVIMDVKDSLEYHYFSDPDFPALFASKGILKMPDGWALLFDYKTCETDSQASKTDTVVFKYGTFIKHNCTGNHPKVISIGYQYVRNFGMIGDHTSNIQINKDGKCYLNYGYDGTGATFYGMADSNALSRLFALATYIDWLPKDDEYYAPVDHDEGCSFHIYFEDGTIKKIHYWGYLPTESEIYLSRLISDISYLVPWRPAAPRRLIEAKDIKARNSAVHYSDNCFTGW
jgi:hypothetical protein